MDVLEDFGFDMIFDIARPEPAGPFPAMAIEMAESRHKGQVDVDDIRYFRLTSAFQAGCSSARCSH